MIMRFRPANISLINRRHYLPRLLLTLSSKGKYKNHFNDSKILTGSHHINFRIAGHPAAVCRQVGFEVPIATPAPDIFFLTSFSCQV
jgi:hypothetical protein